MGVILCKDNNKIAHFKLTFLASGSDNSVHILLMLLTILFSQFIYEQNAAKSCQIKPDLHSLTSFISDKKKITLHMYTFEKGQAIFLIGGWASVHKNNVVGEETRYTVGLHNFYVTLLPPNSINFSLYNYNI